MLFHVGCLVDSAEDRKEAEERGLEVQDFVDGPNTLAVFVRGPEGVSGVRGAQVYVLPDLGEHRCASSSPAAGSPA